MAPDSGRRCGDVMKCHDSPFGVRLRPCPSFRPKRSAGSRSGGIPSPNSGSCSSGPAGIPPLAALRRDDGWGMR